MARVYVCHSFSGRIYGADESNLFGDRASYAVGVYIIAYVFLLPMISDRIFSKEHP